jgi:hypothetical protein
VVAVPSTCSTALDVRAVPLHEGHGVKSTPPMAACDQHRPRLLRYRQLCPERTARTSGFDSAPLSGERNPGKKDSKLGPLFVAQLPEQACFSGRDLSSHVLQLRSAFVREDHVASPSVLRVRASQQQTLPLQVVQEVGHHRSVETDLAGKLELRGGFVPGLGQCHEHQVSA